MTGPLSKTGRTTRIGLVAGLLGMLLALTAGAYAGAASLDPDHDHDRDTPVLATFRVTGSPRRERVLAGSTARYTIRIRRSQFPAAVNFQLVARLPRELRVRFSHRSTRGRRVTLVIRTSSQLRARRYRLNVRASADGVTRTLTLILTIGRRASGTAAAAISGIAAAGGGSGTAAGGDPAAYSISGNAAGPLAPGLTQPLDLKITNPNSTPLTVANLSVAIRAIQAPHATPTLPCSAADFAVQQYSGPLPLVVPASSTSTLAGLGLSPVGRPQIMLLDRPSDQDGCQGASVTLSYTAIATTG